MKLYLIIMTAIFILMQFIRVDRTNPSYDENKEIKAPKEVANILRRSCYDCHSYKTKWPSYSSIAPLSWTISDHVNTGREILNYSIWDNYDEDTKIKKLRRTIQTLNTSIMPLPSYLWIHSDAKLSKDDKKILIDWSKKELDKMGVKTF